MGLLKDMVPERLKVWYRQAQRRRNSSNSFVTRSFCGTDIAVRMLDGLSLGWYGHNWQIEDRMEFIDFRTLDIPENAMIFNIGAHQGIVAILLRRLVSPAGKIIAVELDPLNARACQQNFQRNGERNIIVVNKAVSSEVGTGSFNGGSNNSLASFTNNNILSRLFRQTVATVTVDHMIEEYGVPHLIYIDIEGAEILALKGAKKGLQDIPVWYIEAHGDKLCGRYGGSNHNLIETLLENNYSLLASQKQSSRVVPFEQFNGDLRNLCYILAIKKKIGLISLA